MASFATDSIDNYTYTKARNCKHCRYSYKTADAKKKELEYLADLRLCTRCLIIQIALFLPPEPGGVFGVVYMLEGGVILMY